MKKLLIATAAMAVVAGAQAQSSVTVYGGLDVSYTSTSINNGGASTIQGDSALYSSRLGFKGTEDLGGGLKAEFALEAPVATTTGGTGAAGTQSSATSTTVPAATTFSRAAWVGLTSDKFGSIKLGRMDMTYAEGLDSTVGQMGNLSNVVENLGTDQSKTVQYTTPTFAGFNAQIAYANESKAETFPSATTQVVGEETNGRLTSAAVSYKFGNLTAIAGQTTKKVSVTQDQKETSYGASYNFGVATVGASYTSVDGTTVGTDAKMTRVSVSAPVAALGSGVTAHAVYFKDKTTADDTVTISEKKVNSVDGYKLALTKAFSKRTTGYVAYVDQSDAAAGSTEYDAKAYSVGIVHTF
jgi:predicted porin